MGEERRAKQTPRPTRSKFVLPVLVLLGFGLACHTIGPALTKSSSAKAGPYPDDFREVVLEWIEADFFDVAGVRNLEVSQPMPGFAKGIFDREPRYGWFSRVVFRGTDGLGTSTGKLFYSVLVREGEVVASRKHSY